MYTSNKIALCRYADHIRLTVLNFGRATVNAEWNGTVTMPAFSRLYYIVSGVAFITTRDERVQLKPGHWYLLPADVSFEYECIEEMDHLYFHLKLCDFAGTDRLRTVQHPLSLVLPSETLDCTVQRLHTRDLTDVLWLQQTLYGIVLSFLRAHNLNIHNTSYSSYVLEALQYIQQHLSMQLTVSEISQHCSVSPSTLTKRFRGELSVSVGEYIDTLVMAEAEQLLMTDTLSIAEISGRLGFSDQFYFSKRLKQKFGISPRDFRTRKSL